MNLNIVRLDIDESFPMPQAPRVGDAGVDLVAATGGILSPGDSMVVGCGFSMSVPEGFVGLVCPRSGLSAQHHISVGNAPGVIDSSYRGEVKVILEHRGHKYTGAFRWRRGDRIAQLVIVPYAHVESVIEVNELSTTDRGSGGFGSTGTATSTVTAVSVVASEAPIEETPDKLRSKKANK